MIIFFDSGSSYSDNDLSLDLFNNIFPFSRIIDVVRVVGRQLGLSQNGSFLEKDV